MDLEYNNLFRYSIVTRLQDLLALLQYHILSSISHKMSCFVAFVAKCWAGSDINVRDGSRDSAEGGIG